jgi:hypothetical protein
MARKPIVKVKRSREQNYSVTKSNKARRASRRERQAAKDKLTWSKRGRYARRHPNGE